MTRNTTLRQGAATASASALVALSLAGPTAAAPARTTEVPARATVVLDWNRIMLRTFAQPAPPPVPAVPVPVQALYTAYVGAAVHDAVVAVEGGSTAYVAQPVAPDGASLEAAVSTAAYRTLAALVPVAAADLAAEHQRWLDAVPDGLDEDAGVLAGAEAAQRLLAARTGDGRGATVTLSLTPGPGVWTPPATGMLTPWLGFVRPFALPSPTSIPLGGPDALGSEAYAEDFAEVERMGSRTGSERTHAQTQLALFYTANAVAQYNTALQERLLRHAAGAREAARAFGLLGIATADSIITCWRTKYDEVLWRPDQAIRQAAADGNPATSPDAAWEPLVPDPPYPEYASGHACLTGAFSRTLAKLYGPSRIDVNVESPVTGTTRHYGHAAALNRDTKNARIWLGLHFRKAMDDGNRIGRKSADYTVANYLRPVS